MSLRALLTFCCPGSDLRWCCCCCSCTAVVATITVVAAAAVDTAVVAAVTILVVATVSAVVAVAVAVAVVVVVVVVTSVGAVGVGTYGVVMQVPVLLLAAPLTSLSNLPVLGRRLVISLGSAAYLLLLVLLLTFAGGNQFESSLLVGFIFFLCGFGNCVWQVKCVACNRCLASLVDLLHACTLVCLFVPLCLPLGL